MTEQTLDQALTLTANGAGGLTADLTTGFSNSPQSWPGEKGAPFGGLMSALAVKAPRQALEIAQPLRTVSVQFLIGARFEPLTLTSEKLRGGRSAVYTSVRAGQQDRLAMSAQVTFGSAGDGPEVRAATIVPPPLEDQLLTPMGDGFAPHFLRHVEHRFVGGIKLFGKNITDRMGVWMRTVDGRPLDEARLAFLLDATFPVYWTMLPPPPAVSATADLRYDFFGPVPENAAPDGWTYFEFVSRDSHAGWTVEDATAWAQDGRPLAVGRQLRKVMATRAV
ncbi:MAG: thioesterase family protein [Brevundimonas sp.]|uniref:acyl-CoA thioesterase n=1 Tax=Brevundimonas sp. TaxID=1871086 RepID=UPI001A2B2E6E|nr:thioesterase family protein [Brevundimonas sp.]MBJ7447626.1 thioesterase family protein [Brevundimonas sp.]